MLPPAFDLLTRLLGIVVTLFLTFSPWLVAVDSQDPFLNQGWLTFGLGILAIGIPGLLLPLFRPRRNQLPMIVPGLFTWGVLVVSTLQSPFLVSLRTSLLMATQLGFLFFLRMARKSRDSFILAASLAMSGTGMAIYGLLQSQGHDFLNWVDSPYKVVGTFSNPNFLAAYLMVTALLTIGLFFHENFGHPLTKLFIGAAFALQLSALSMTNCSGAWLCLFAGVYLLSVRFWEVLPGSVFRRSPFVGGLVSSVFLVGGYCLITFATRSYPWDTLTGPPHGYFSIISRLLEWQMGFMVFLNHPFFGLGPGGLPYVLAGFRPPLGTVLGLATFNDDPHSHVLLLLGETGILGLIGFCSIGAALIGVHSHFRNRQGNRFLTDDAPVFSDNEKPRPTIRSQIPDEWLGKVLAVCILTLFLHSLFNNTLTILPLSNLLVLLVSLHQSVCLRDIVWKRGFSFISLGYMTLPLLYGLSAWTLQVNHREATTGLFQGNVLLERGQPVEAEARFEGVLRANPQSIFGIWGLARAMEKQGRLARVQDLLGRLDNLGPNLLGTKYHLSRILFERNMIPEAHRYAIKNLAWSQSPSTYELLGRILVTEGRIQEAEQILEEGLLLIPSWSEEERGAANKIRLQVASIEIDQNKFREARRHLTQLSPPDANSKEFFYLRGLIEYKNHNATQALGLFEQALAQNASEPKCMNAVGYLLVELNGDLVRAQALLEEAYKGYRSRNPPFLSDILTAAHSLGTLYWKQGKLDKAEELLTIAFSQCPLVWKDIREERSQSLKRFFQETGRKPAMDQEIASGTP